MRELEIVATGADGGVARDVISGHVSNEEAVALAMQMFLDYPVVEVWERQALIAHIGDNPPPSGRHRDPLPSPA